MHSYGSEGESVAFLAKKKILDDRASMVDFSKYGSQTNVHIVLVSGDHDMARQVVYGDEYVTDIDRHG